MSISKAYKPASRSSYDVVIVGGAVIGSSVAYWLSHNPDFDGHVLVVERDSSYALASTTLSTSAIRQQFSNPVNIKISQFGIEFIEGFGETMAPYYSDAPPNLQLREYGYLYCVPPEGVDKARELVDLQRQNGAHTVFLNPGQLKEQFPWLNVDDLGGGSWGAKGEGWFDSTGLMRGFQQAAKGQGVEYIDNEVVDIVVEHGKVVAVKLQTGETVYCGVTVNAAGPRAAKVAQMAGLSIPVEPRKRHTFIFACDTPIEGRMPNVINLDGTFVRPEGELFLSGNTPTPDVGADVDDFVTKHDEFYDYMWMSLGTRIPQFEAIKVKQFWTGQYAFNTLDHNAIVGWHPRVDNFMFVNGFSGHGLQQSPAMGRGVMELLVYNEFRTLDLSPFCYARIERNEPFSEEAII